MNPYKIHMQDEAYILTIQVVSWVDIFTRKSYRYIVIDAFNFAISNKGLTVHCWQVFV
ncbi:MAG: hypothetical protein ABI763_11190 [Bacteroidota bacterium]